MPQPSRETSPSHEPFAVRVFFDTQVEQADGDIGAVISAVADPFDALRVIYGYADRLAQTAGVDQSEAYKHAIVGINSHLRDASAGDFAWLRERHELWDPVSAAVTLREEKGSAWPSISDAVHFFDEANERLLRGD